MKNTLSILLITIAITFAACKSKSNAVSQKTVSDTEEIPTVNWNSKNFKELQKTAIYNGKMVFLDVSASWCGYCRNMKRTVYTKPSVAKALNHKYVSSQIDGEAGEGFFIVKKYGVSVFPTQLILDTKGELLKKNEGYLTDKQLLNFLD